MRALASNWRVSGILCARSGSRVNITSGRDNAFPGIAFAADPVSDDIYGPGKDASGLEQVVLGGMPRRCRSCPRGA